MLNCFSSVSFLSYVPCLCHPLFLKSQGGTLGTIQTNSAFVLRGYDFYQQGNVVCLTGCGWSVAAPTRQGPLSLNGKG